MEPISLDAATQDLPEADFYGGDAELDTDPDEVYTQVCAGLDLPDPGDDAEIVARAVSATPTDGLSGSTAIVDESLYVFTSVGKARSYMADLLADAADCDSYDTATFDLTTVEYSFESAEYDENGWSGYVTRVTLDVDVPESDPYGDEQGAEVDITARRGNLVAYASWLITAVEDVEEQFDEIESKIGEFLDQLPG